MHSFLITNWSGVLVDLPEFIKAKFPRTDSAHHPDILILEPNPSITISQVRTLKAWLSRKPYQAQSKLALILKAEALTLPAQHALLKSLEEPPDNTIIILSTTNPDSLLPTIHSRCQLINLPKARTSGVSLVDSPEVDNLTPGQRLSLATSYTTKDQGLALCQALIWHLRPKLPQTASKLRLLQSTHTLLQQNINPKLALEHLFLNI